jgi:hypothetical protein
VHRKIILLFLASYPAFSQTCNNSFPDLRPRGTTIFSQEQEGYLGDVIAEQMQRRLPVYRQPGLTEPLDQITARLLQHLPANEYRFQFSIIEIPQANAFAIPGGRIFVSRRLIAFVQNEDELAGVLAHEMGHVLTRQGSVDMTKSFNGVLKVSSVGDRTDVAQKFNRLLDTIARKPPNQNHEEDDQVVADRMSLEAVWRSGYDPQAFARFLDRLTENKGAAGNFLTDLFGATRPESKRFRELLKDIDAISPVCRETRSAAGNEEFRTWQKRITELSPEDLVTTRSNRLPTLRLSPKLRPEITRIRFSPDGHILFAQDQSGIHVLNRDPFQYLFRIPALNAPDAVFDKDSKHVMFTSASSRIEVWNLETRSRERVWEPRESESCFASPDGHTAACISLNDVALRDMDTGAEIGRHVFPQQAVFTGLLQELLMAFGAIPSMRHAEFSPDGLAFLVTATTAYCCDRWSFDVRQKKEIAIGGALRGALGVNFAFMGPDRVAASHPTDMKESGVFSWPDGKAIDKFPIPNSSLESVTKGPVILVRPLGDYAAGALNVEDKQIFQVSTKSALDRYEDTGAAERGTGEIALYPGRKTQPIATLQLPEAELGRLRSAVHSPDLEWLSLSIQSRSVLWNLKSGQSALNAPFDGGHISAEGMWTATFEQTEPNPNKQGSKQVFSRTSLDLRQLTVSTSSKLPDKQAGRSVAFTGPYEITVTADTPKKGKYTLQVKDTVADRVDWSRELDELPARYLADALVLRFAAQDKYADTVIKKSPELKKRLDAMPKRQDTFLLEVLELGTGKPLGYVLVDNGGGSVFIRSVRVAGRVLFVEDNNNRTLAYSLDTGERTGQQFGQVLAVDAARGLAAVQNQPGRLVVLDGSMQPVADFEYPRNVVYAGFDGSGKRLLAVTGAQEVFVEYLP